MPRYSLSFLLHQRVLIPTLAVIRVFGIFTHGEIRRKQFWDTLSQQLQRRGSDYIERCTFQDKPLSPDENSIPPAQFPPSSYQVQDIPQVAPLIKPHEEDMKAVSEMASAF